MRAWGTVILGALLLLSPHRALAHPGGLDANGCHHNRRTGDYHCHRGPSSGQHIAPPAPAARQTPAQGSEKTTFSGPYQAEVVRVIDGDSIAVNVLSWPHETKQIIIRLSGLDAPELHGSPTCEKQLAEAARAFVADKLAPGTTVTVSNLRPDKYSGRYLAQMAVGGADLGDAILKAGHARPYDGGSRAAAWCAN
ncbi:MAG: thermonuclease family protein [Nitrospirota bacterium]|nr:thermonuclease family protein [Nitrospirota bacterium]